ncbi:dynein axonemal assembly factor 8-like isoform X2 [Mytilus galloprovincialis]
MMELSDDGGGDSEVTMSSLLGQSQLKPKLDDIFAEVEKNLPSIDFDLSDVSSDNEEPIIFHRNLKSSIFDDDKDLDTSLDDPDIISLSGVSFEPADLTDIYDNDLAFQLQQGAVMKSSPKPVSTKTVSSWTEIVMEAENRPEVTPPDKQEVTSHDVGCGPDNGEGLNLNEALKNMENELLNNQMQDSYEKHERESTAETEKKKSSTWEAIDVGDKKMNSMLRKEVRRDEERELAHSILSPRAPTLVPPGFDPSNIDTLLNQLNEDNQFAPPINRSNQQRLEALYASGEGNQIENNEQNQNLSLIQRLALISTRVSGEDLTDVCPMTGVKQQQIIEEAPQVINKWKPIPQSQPEPEKKQTSSCGTNTSDMPVRIITPTVRPVTKPTVVKKEPPKSSTVFIDLRDFEKTRQEQQQSIERVQRILHLSGDRDSSDDSDDEVDTWQKQRQKMKESLKSKGLQAEALPSKPTPHGPIKKPQRVLNLDHVIDSRARTAPQVVIETEQLSEEDMEAKLRAEQEEKEKHRKVEEARKRREQREAERQARIRLSKRLEALRPSAAVSGKQDSAEGTPVVFDIEASYEPAPRTLPPTLGQDHKCLLLTIHLSSNGEIILHRGKSRSADTGVGLSASYTVLLSWLLSLVPHDFTFLQKEEEDNTPLPFYILGLQQECMDEQLCLQVAVAAPRDYDKQMNLKTKKSKVKDEMKGCTAFQHFITKFLSTNTLHSVCPWLVDMVSVEVPCSQVDNTTEKPTYVYRPPLPNITTKPLSTFIQVNPDQQAAQKVFNSSVGFFWQTIDSEEAFCDQNVGEVNYDTQVTMSLIYRKIFYDPRAMMGICNRILQEGLDLAGVRLLYPTSELISLASGPSVSNDNSQTDVLNSIGPVLAISLRGTFARSIWLDAVGPSDPVLARRTDPNSLCALFGGESRDECLLFCPRNASRVQTELSRWFGGRVPPGGSVDVGTPYTRRDTYRSGSPKGRKGRKSSLSDTKDNDINATIHRPPAALTATTKNDIFLVLSPHVPPKCMGIVLSTCQRRGYQIRGVRRSKLNTKKANLLGISGETVPTFCPGALHNDVVTDQCKHIESVYPCTLILLQKENASHGVASLIEACMVQLTLQGVMGTIQQQASIYLSSKHMFHAARYSDSLLSQLGGDFSKCFDFDVQVNPSCILPKLYTNPEVEQIVVLLLLGNQILKSCGLFIGKLLHMVPYSKTVTVLPLKEGFELLGIKWVPSLSISQAKDVTPYEVGDRGWKENLHTLTTEPALVLVLRGINAFKRMEQVIPRPDPKSGHMDYLMSRTAEEAYSFTRAFYTDKELYGDPHSRPLLPYLPLSKVVHTQASNDSIITRSEALKESIFHVMTAGPQLITTHLIIKPRAVKRHLPKIVKKIIQEGFRVIAMKFQILLDEDIHYILKTDENLDSEIADKTVDYLKSGPSLCLVLQRENAVKKLIDLLGPSDPSSARRQSQFLWRGTFGVDTVNNAFHGSMNYIKALEDQKTFFPDGLCCKSSEYLVSEQIFCPAEDSILDIKYQMNREIVVHDPSEHPDCPDYILMETTCLVFKPPLITFKRDGTYGYADLIEGLVTHGFEIYGCRMVWFTQEQAEHFLHVIDAGSFKQVPLLISGPCIVLGLQRDNAILAFDSIMGSDYGAESLIGKYGEMIFRPADTKQAHKMLMFFFDKLIPGGQCEILSKHHST